VLYHLFVRYLLTGAAGFIGSNFAKYLIDLEQADCEKVTVLDKLTYAGNLENLAAIKDSRIEFIKGDICDNELVSDLLTKHDVVIHFAAESHVDRSISGPSDFVQTNVVGTQVLLDAVRNNPKVRFVHVSTDEVYGSIDVGSWDESYPLIPNSPYSASKASSDLLALAYARTYDLDIVVTRCCNNYGPNQFPEKMIPLFVTNLMDGKKVPLYGDGQNIREWIHVEDHCRAIWDVAQKGKPGEVYNIGSGVELTNLEITKMILNEFGYGDEMIEQVADRLNHDRRYSLDSSKIKNELGWNPQWDFADGIKSTIDWYKTNRSWWEPLKTR
jgi:dTDP-glucose 4,6-dehydratase